MNPVPTSRGSIRFGRGREVWSEVEPFMLLGRLGAVPSTTRETPKPRAHLVLLPRQEDRP